MKILKAIILVACVVSLFTSCVSLPVHHENLGNPTEYLYTVSSAQINEALHKLLERAASFPGGFRENGEFGFGFRDRYSDRYWNGPREIIGDIHVPEAGRIGTINGFFRLQITSEGDKCRVKVIVESFEQQIERTYAVFPHFHKTGQRVSVKSDTFFEYKFLRTLGDLVGEKNMPPLKGSDVNDEEPGKRF